MPLEGGAAGRVDVELRHGRVGRHAVVDPGALEAAREHLVLGRLDHALPREVRRGGEGRGDGDGQRDPGDPTRQEERRGDQPDDEETEGEAAGRRPRPRQLRLDAHPQRAGDGVDARLVRELAEGQDQWERQRATAPIAVATSGRGRPDVEPDDEPDEPQREEVEPVTVVEPVEAERAARERGDDERGRRHWRRRTAPRMRPPERDPALPARASVQSTIGATATGTIAR